LSYPNKKENKIKKNPAQSFQPREERTNDPGFRTASSRVVDV
jgi:hypothetical protein